MKNNKAINPTVVWDPSSKYLAAGQCDCDSGDCACSGIETIPFFPLMEFIPTNTKLRVCQTSKSIKINEHYYVWFSPEHSFVLLNDDAQQILFLFNDGATFEEATLAIEKKESYLLAMQKLFQAGLLISESPVSLKQDGHQILTVWLHITDRCNLRCEYCYLPHIKEDMSIETGKAAIDAVFRSAEINGYKHVKFKYAGGEPLIKFENVITLHTYAKGKGAQLGIDVKGIILTNGTLLNNKIAQEIKNHNLSVMISLDGVGKAHDSHRPYLGGRGSFNDVKNAIITAKKFGIIPDISITVSGKTANSLYSVVEWVLEQDLPFSINFYRENELSISNESLAFDDANIINGLKKAYKVIEKNLPRRSLVNSLVDRANLSVAHTKTCSVGSNYLVFDQNGKVSKCQMDMKHFIADVQTHDPLDIIVKDKTGIQNLPVFQKECKTCEWQSWCTGGCPLVTFRATGRYDLKSPNCLIYKAIYPDVIKLEGLRLLKYNISKAAVVPNQIIEL